MRDPVGLDGIELIHVALPLREPFQTSRGRWEHRRAVLVHARGRDGAEGWGELVAPEWPVYVGETLADAVVTLRESLIPQVLASDAMPPPCPDAPMARASLEGAIQDLEARRAGQPLGRWLGGTRDRVQAGIVLGLGTDAAHLVERVSAARADGYRQVKLKVAPGAALDHVAAVRRAHPDLRLTVDANGAFDPTDDSDWSRLLDLDLHLVEQPFPAPDLAAHAAAGRRGLRISLDESLPSPAAATRAIEVGGIVGFSVKAGRVGGLDEARAIHDLAVEGNILPWAGGMLETDVGRHHALALATLSGFADGGELSAADRYFAVDLTDPPIRLQADGTLDVAPGPGIGATVRPDVLESISEHREWFARSR